MTKTVVTGASAGVGRATARAFGARGDRVALLARSASGLADACAEVEETGGTALAIPTDVADAEQVEAAAERVERELGPVSASRASNLYAPVEGLHATHGRFDAQAKRRSPDLWLAEHRSKIAGGAVAGIAALALRRR
jgi:NAD(P)-dependent dehydrogenase (short-subunit alcohol dehydrogenase family)